MLNPAGTSSSGCCRTWATRWELLLEEPACRNDEKCLLCGFVFAHASTVLSSTSSTKWPAHPHASSQAASRLQGALRRLAKAVSLLVKKMWRGAKRWHALSPCCQ